LSQTTDGALDTREALGANPGLKGSVSQVIEKGHLQTLISSNDSIRELIFFDESGLLITEDPKFHYFIRHLIWSGFARRIGFYSIEFKSQYDFALSFAGADRTLADALFIELQSREFEVFYDRNEQHRILANDVEEYLAPIYRSEARYVIVLMSADYPRRIWTKFESAQFKGRFGDGAVIPVVYAGLPVGLFDVAGSVGYASYDPSQPLGPQVVAIADLLTRKLADEAVTAQS
jgi:hypothetical protein